MTEHRDAIGKFIIPDDLLETTRKYVPPTIENEVDTSTETPWGNIDISDGPKIWTIVKQIKSSDGKSVHTIERKERNLRCSCQSFKIRKVGSCKHTKLVAKELGL